MDTCGCLSLLAYTAKWLYLLMTHGFLRDGMWSICSLRTRFRACESFRGACNSRMVSPILFHPNRVIVFYSEKISSSFGGFLFILMSWYADEGPISKRREHVSLLGMPMGIWWAIANGHMTGHCQWAYDGPCQWAYDGLLPLQLRCCEDISQSEDCAHLAANVHTFYEDFVGLHFS